MDEKVAIILDTNFIFAKAKQMSNLLQLLKEKYGVYITQISIDERKEQKCREFERDYKNVEKFFLDWSYLIRKPNLVEINKALDEIRNRTQKKYELSFSEHIIPLNTSAELLEIILERANRKKPPFSTDEKASDKGFKDTLLWLSVLEYFKTNGESEVIFISNDGGFRKEMDSLCQEFKEYTKKTITIKDNNFYADVEQPRQATERKYSEIVPPDINSIREKVHDVISDLNVVEEYDYWGNAEWHRTFKLNEKVDSDYMEVIFKHLRQDITNNLLETTVPADKILGLDNRVANLASIPMKALENALGLYEEIKTTMPDFLPQFFSAAANIINNNYEESSLSLPVSDEDEDLPF